MNTYTAIVKKRGEWWIGWIEEVPGVNAQERTRELLHASLKEVLAEALEFNRWKVSRLGKRILFRVTLQFQKPNDDEWIPKHIELAKIPIAGDVIGVDTNSSELSREGLFLG